MQFKNSFYVAVLAAALGGCGGGGSADTAAPPVVVVPPVVVPPSVLNPIDPYTNKPAAGAALTTLNGIVFSTEGAIVNAYLVQPDGSNGAMVGASNVTDSTGKYQIQFTKAPSGMIRLVSAGGSTLSPVDQAHQTNAGFEAVVPYLTSNTDNLVITPLTTIISHLIEYKSKSGATLNAAFLAATNTALNISAPNIIINGNSQPGIDLLKTIPGSSSDTNQTYRDVLMAFEWFGVRYDLPSKAVTRILASYAENSFPLAGVDGANKSINVGKWNQGIFDDSFPFTLDELTAQKNSDGSNIIVGGIIVHDYVKNYIATDLIQYFYRDNACVNEDKKQELFIRYPNDAGLYSDVTLKEAVCKNISNQMIDLKKRITTNIRNK